jgi:hypothetical protein
MTNDLMTKGAQGSKEEKEVIGSLIIEHWPLIIDHHRVRYDAIWNGD